VCQPQQKYYVPGLPVDVVNVPTELRSRLAAAMQVGHPARLDLKQAQLAATACVLQCFRNSVSGTACSVYVWVCNCWQSTLRKRTTSPRTSWKAFHVSIRIDGGVCVCCCTCLCCLPINLFNAHAFNQSTAVRVVTSTYDIPYTRVLASAPTAGISLTVGQWKMNEHMKDITDAQVEQLVQVCMQRQDTLFTAFALAQPRSFPGVAHSVGCQAARPASRAAGPPARL